MGFPGEIEMKTQKTVRADTLSPHGLLRYITSKKVWLQKVNLLKLIMLDSRSTESLLVSPAFS